MEKSLKSIIFTQNPWLEDPKIPINQNPNYIERLQFDFLTKPDWNEVWTVILGPRQAGKTTLGKHLCQILINNKQFDQLLYLNCDVKEIREWLNSSNFLRDIDEFLSLKNYILFIDEVQRLDSPGILLKIIADLKLPIKMIASGSSQLEIRSQVQEHLTGRQLEVLILPLSCREVNFQKYYESLITYGSYPQVYLANQKEIFLQELFRNYVQKDVIEFLKIGKPDVILNLIGLLAHSSGQLLNFQQLAADCHVNVETVRHYIDVLEKTYVINLIRPYVGNKRTELTSNPICYFIDNGFRNIALNNFTPLNNRTDSGLLIENLIYQELYKYIVQERKNWRIHYWRTKAGAEVDFILRIDYETAIPIEVKYRNFKNYTLSRGFQSFLEAYKPKQAFIINRNQEGKIKHKDTDVYFIPLEQLLDLFMHLPK